MNTTQQTTASRGVAPAIAWGLAPIGWFLLLMGWVGLDGDLSGPVQTALGIAILVLPAPWLLWASWRMPRPQVKTYLAEGGGLAALLLSLFVTAVYFLLGADPTETASMGFTAVYFAAAAVLIAAAWPLPGRRIAYGVAALGCAIFAISVQVPQWRTGAHMDSKLAIADEVLLNLLLGSIVLGMLLQIAWWLLGKRRAI
ncbi:hypothetical protein [Glycomyces harbinensis]|uniref:Transmembrane protein n=1 Tax=Glycomyces harbinensis TaxID=58114 RepID=A0A1G6ZN20_9ACTN|nr:hypothetical protein [Glycomyces harbinensis]SDE03921.1 hypothetical protein SAMN05216270_111101 [Glycomyces harbinensis]